MSDRVDGHAARSVFLAALEHEGDARTAFVRGVCHDDPILHAEITALLQAHARADALLPAPSLDAARQDLLAPGERIGDFVIDARLGRGGFGEVYRATQLALQRTVALKVTRIGDPRDGGARLIREARAAGAVHDPHLVEVYLDGTDLERGLGFYAMRFVPGPTLSEVLRRLAAAGPPPASLRRDLVQRGREVCRALAALHERNLVHRDVAPGNVILEGAGLDAPWRSPARLLDYGLVRPAHALVSMPLGTIGYAAPEVTSTELVDARVDVYGVGALLHDMLSGRDPATPLPSPRFPPLRQIVSDLDPDLEAIVARCTAGEPRRRFADARELGAELDAWLGGRRTARQTRRTRVRFGLALLGAAIAFGAAGSLVAARARAARLWEDGALVAAQDLTRALPLRFARALIPASLRAGHDEPVASVLRQGATHGEAAALLLAARHLERDGLAAHPLLARFLRWAIDPCSARPDLLPTAHRLVGQIFFERPDENEAAVEHSRPMAATLALALPHLEPKTCAWTLVALEGCGTPAELDAIAAAAASTDGEVARLAVSALDGMVRRAVRCAFAEPLHRADLAAVIGTTIRSVFALHPEPATVSGFGLDWLAVDAIFLLRRHERAAGVHAIVSALPEPVDLVRAAAEDLDLRAQLLAHGPARPLDRNEHAAYGVFQAYGQLTGAMGSDELDTKACAMVTAAAVERGLDAGFAGMVYASARDELTARRAGQTPNDSPDAASHLGADSALAPPPMRPIECVRFTEGSHASVTAAWHFDAGAPRLEHRATALHARAVDLAVPEEMRPERTFARLATFGVSALRLEFDMPATVVTPGLVMLVQKGIRRRLPISGEVVLDIAVDSRHAARMPLSSATLEHVRLPLGHLSAGPHVLDVTMRADSTTTLRIVRVAVEQ